MYRLEKTALKSVCKYVNEQIDLNNIDESTYISTENMLPNKSGVVKSSKLPETKKVRKFLDGDILISNIRPYFKKIWYATTGGGCSNDILVIRSNEGVDSKFLYYVLSNDEFFNYAMTTAKGTKMPRGDKNAIMEYKIPLISNGNQKKIANILDIIDKKIVINNKQNDNLSELIDVLFKRWFIDYEFPISNDLAYRSSNGEMKSSEFGMIPLTWDIIEMGKFLNERKERVGERDITEYSTTNFGIQLRDDKFNKQLSRNKEKNKVIYKDDIVFGMSRQILNFGVMKDDIGAVSSAYHIFKINRDIYIPVLLEIFMRLKPTMFLDLIKPAAREGQGIDKQFLEIKRIPVPDYNIQKCFFEIYYMIQNSIDKIINETNNLVKLKDTLLPKLMLGEIDLNNFEINI